MKKEKKHPSENWLESQYEKDIYTLTPKKIKTNKMTKTEILNDLQMLIDLASTTHDSFSFNRITKIKESLESLWTNEEMYAEEIKQVLNYDETMFNLNNIKIR